MKRSKRRPAGTSLRSVVGGMLIGLDEQLLRATPRVEVLVKRGQVVRGTSAAGGDLLIGLPDDAVPLPGDAAEASPPADDAVGGAEPPRADPLVY